MLSNCFYFALVAKPYYPNMSLRVRNSFFPLIPHFYLEDDDYVLEALPLYNNPIINVICFIFLFGCFPIKVCYCKKLDY